MSSVWQRRVAVFSAIALAVACMAFAGPGLSADADGHGVTVIVPTWIQDDRDVDDAVIGMEVVSAEIGFLEGMGLDAFVYMPGPGTAPEEVLEAAGLILGEGTFIDEEAYVTLSVGGARVLDSVDDTDVLDGEVDTGFLARMLEHLRAAGADVRMSVDDAEDRAMENRMLASMMSIAAGGSELSCITVNAADRKEAEDADDTEETPIITVEDEEPEFCAPDTACMIDPDLLALPFNGVGCPQGLFQHTAPHAGI